MTSADFSRFNLTSL